MVSIRFRLNREKGEIREIRERERERVAFIVVVMPN